MADPSFTIDLNSDLGESFGAHQIGYDSEIFPLISSANVACGFHGGDPRVIERTVQTAIAHGVAIGAHPGYPDLVGFGRRQLAASPDELRSDTLYQLGALAAFCHAAGVPLQHIKPHGALSNRVMTDTAAATAIVTATQSFDPTLRVLAQPGSALLAAAEAVGQPVLLEGFADRAYNPDGSLVSRRLPGAMITDPEVAAARIVKLITTGRLTAIDGTELRLEVDSICVHSDTPGAVEILHALRRQFAAAGIAVQAPLAQ